MKINWSWFLSQLVDELGTMPSGHRLLTLGLSDIIRRAGGGADEPKTFRQRSYWVRALRSDGILGHAKEFGVSISYSPDRPGSEVQEVTFRLDG